jgi:hypothetical protein
MTVAACSAASQSAPDAGPSSEQTSDTGSDAHADQELAPAVEAGSSVVCDNGGERVPQVHRPQTVACPSARGAGAEFTPGADDECTTDATCTSGLNGRCMVFTGHARCSYDACTSDADCAAGTVCECRPGGTSNIPNVCLRSDCRVDDDCGAAGYCSRSAIPGSIPVWVADGDPGYGTDLSNGYFCHTTNDCCMDNADCAANGVHFDHCLFAKDHWLCRGGP